MLCATECGTPTVEFTQIRSISSSLVAITLSGCSFLPSRRRFFFLLESFRYSGTAAAIEQRRRRRRHYLGTRARKEWCWCGSTVKPYRSLNNVFFCLVCRISMEEGRTITECVNLKLYSQRSIVIWDFFIQAAPRWTDRKNALDFLHASTFLCKRTGLEWMEIYVCICGGGIQTSPSSQEGPATQ